MFQLLQINTQAVVWLFLVTRLSVFLQVKRILLTANMATFGLTFSLSMSAFTFVLIVLIKYQVSTDDSRLHIMVDTQAC